MKNKKNTVVLRVIKWFSISIVAILLLLFLAPIVFPGTVAQEIKTFANQKLDGELNFSKARLSFFNHFPSLTVTLYDFSLKGSAPFKKDTLIAAKEVAFGVNLKNLLLHNNILIDKIFLSESFLNVKVNKNGEANYNVYVSTVKKPDETNSDTAIRLEKIEINNCNIRYEDQSLDLLIDAKGFNYLGKGDLSKSIFDLETDAEIADLSFSYANEPYLRNKKIKANLVTQINTNSLAFSFQKNDLVINNLPVNFKAQLAILESGYNIDFAASSKNSDLKDLFTALPPEYMTWLNKTEVKGKIDLDFSFKGNYNATNKTNPDLIFGVNIRDGFIQYKNAPLATSNIKLNFKTVLPAMNLDNLSVKIDSLSFNLGKDYLKAYVATKGLKTPTVNAAINATLDLEKLDQSLGLSEIDLKGLLNMDLTSNGQYNPEKHSFPITKAKILLRNGSIKTALYPNPITNINLDANVLNTLGNFKSTTVSIAPASFTFEGNPFDLDAKFSNFDDVSYDIHAKGTFDVGKVYQVFSQKGLDVTGLISANLALKGIQSDAAAGRYAKLDNSGTLLIKNIETKSDFFPKTFVINEGLFSFKKEKMIFDKFTASYGQSDFELNGHLNNVINYVFEKNGTLNGNFNLNSDVINVNEFMALQPADNASATALKTENKQTSSAAGVVVVPTNLNVALTAHAKKVIYDQLQLNNLNGTVAIKKGQLTMQQTAFELIGCKVLIDGTYDDVNTKRAGFDVHFRANDFDVKRAYNEIEMFRSMATAAEKAEGIISIDYKINGTLNENMDPIYSSLIGKGTVSLRKVKVKGLKMFSVISSETGSDGMNDPELSKVEIKTTIKNNLIYIEKTRMGVALFRLRFEGTTSFNEKLNLKMRLGLPPLGIIGIPFTITGTQDNPKIKLFSKKTEETEGTDYDGKMIIKNESLEEKIEGKTGESIDNKVKKDSI